VRRGPALAAALAAGAVLPTSLAGADSFTPVRLAIKIAPVARRHVPLPISVRVSADAGVLDTRTAPLRIRVKLARECGGTYKYTRGTVLLNKQLRPQPKTGKPYSAKVRGSGRPRSFGVMTVCAFLDEEGDQRTFASDQSIQVNVSRACTRAAARYDSARRAGRASGALRRKARRVCGRGVKL
jgi:hypothetical protein